MTVSPVEALNNTFEKTHIWLKELAAEGRFLHEAQAYSAMRAVMHALRDRLRVDDAAHLSAQLPLLVRGMFFEGWKPAATPTRERTLAEFLDRVRVNLGVNSEVDPHVATRAVFALLERKISPGEVDNLRSLLPEGLRDVWPAVHAAPLM